MPEINKQPLYTLKYEPRNEQIDALEFVKHNIRRGKKYMMLNAPTGIGKAQPLYNKILTPNGWAKLSELKINDKVITPNGKKSNIIQLHPIQKLDIYKITFYDGRTSECTLNHLWKVHSHDWSNKWKIVDTDTIYKKLNKSSNKLHIPLIINNINNKNINLPIDPYLLGCLLGDGSITQNISITSNDDFIIDKLINIVKKYNMNIKKYKNDKKNDYGIVYKQGHKNTIKEILKNINLHGKKSENKFIPTIYKQSSYKQKIDIINGLLDTDGTVSKSGSISFSSCSYKLMTDLQEIIWSIGGIAKIKPKKSNYKYKHKKNIKKHYILHIRYSEQKTLFSLPRKINKLPNKYQYKNLKLKILSIEKCNKTEDTRCITIDSKEQLYITDDYVVTHNSYFAVMLMNWYTMHINPDAKFDLLTNSKILQNQYVNEFPFIKSLKGQNSYLCNTYGGSCQEGKEMSKALKRKCTDCPYDQAFMDWITSKVSLTNFHLFNTYHIFLPQVIENKQRNVLIIDEAHDFESVLCDFITMKITERNLKGMGFSDSRILGIKKHLLGVTNVYRFVDFINDFFLVELDMLLDNMQSRLSDNRIVRAEKLKTSKYITNTHSAIESYKKFIKSIEEDEGEINNWVLEITKEEKKSEKGRKPLLDKSYTIQPIWSNKYLHNYIWQYYDHIIFMSGTILDKSMFSYLNGLEPKLTAYHDIKSPFALKRRPIYYIKVGKMTFTEKENTFKKQVKVLDKIVNRNENKKGIIHTFNYEISDLLKKYYGENGRMLFHTSENRDEILEKHIRSKEPTILVSPSLMNGVDLKDDLSRFQVIMKIPYPNLKSEKIKKRMSDNKEWYGFKTCIDIQQMYGRSIRSIDDYAETYILDESLSNVLKYNYKFLPEYFTEAIKVLK